MAMLHVVLHRKTHDSRMFTLPLIRLPGITERDELLEWNSAESYLYETISVFCIAMMNSKAKFLGKR
jgi:hypothetical protein